MQSDQSSVKDMTDVLLISFWDSQLLYVLGIFPVPGRCLEKARL